MRFFLLNSAVCDSCQQGLEVEVHLVCYFPQLKLPLRVLELEEVHSHLIPSMSASIYLVFVLVVCFLGIRKSFETLPWNWTFPVEPLEKYLT